MLFSMKEKYVYGSVQWENLFLFSSFLFRLSPLRFWKNVFVFLWSPDYFKTHPHKWQADWQASIWSKHPASGNGIKSSSLFMIGGWVTAQIQSFSATWMARTGKNSLEVLALLLPHPPPQISPRCYLSQIRPMVLSLYCSTLISAPFFNQPDISCRQ